MYRPHLGQLYESVELNVRFLFPHVERTIEMQGNAMFHERKTADPRIPTPRIKHSIHYFFIPKTDINHCR